MAIQLKKRKSAKNPIEISCVAWIDLLGYGAMLQEAKFDPSHPSAVTAITRLEKFHQTLATSAFKFLPFLPLNDGAASHRDLSPRTRGVTYDFLQRAWQVHQEVNRIDQSLDHPGARTVIAVGARVRTLQNQMHDLPQCQDLIEQVSIGTMSPSQAIHEAFRYRSPLSEFSELHANFALSKAYLADHSGSKAGLGGPHCYVDLAIFSKALPSWVEFSSIVPWAEHGFHAEFGLLNDLLRKKAGAVKHTGILDARQIALRLGIELI